MYPLNIHLFSTFFLELPPDAVSHTLHAWGWYIPPASKLRPKTRALNFISPKVSFAKDCRSFRYKAFVLQVFEKSAKFQYCTNVFHQAISTACISFLPCRSDSREVLFIQFDSPHLPPPPPPPPPSSSPPPASSGSCPASLLLLRSGGCPNQGPPACPRPEGDRQGSSPGQAREQGRRRPGRPFKLTENTKLTFSFFKPLNYLKI